MSAILPPISAGPISRRASPWTAWRAAADWRAWDGRGDRPASPTSAHASSRGREGRGHPSGKAAGSRRAAGRRSAARCLELRGEMAHWDSLGVMASRRAAGALTGIGLRGRDRASRPGSGFKAGIGLQGQGQLRHRDQLRGRGATFDLPHDKAGRKPSVASPQGPTASRNLLDGRLQLLAYAAAGLGAHRAARQPPLCSPARPWASASEGDGTVAPCATPVSTPCVP